MAKIREENIRTEYVLVCQRERGPGGGLDDWRFCSKLRESWKKAKKGSWTTTSSYGGAEKFSGPAEATAAAKRFMKSTYAEEWGIKVVHLEKSVVVARMEKIKLVFPPDTSVVDKVGALERLDEEDE